MALSNVFREPRRELTETGIGIVVVGSLLAADFAFGRGFAIGIAAQDVKNQIAATLLGMILLPALVFFTFVLLLIMHGVGEDICDRLQRSGIHLRPKRRVGRN